MKQRAAPISILAVMLMLSAGILGCLSSLSPLEPSLEHVGAQPTPTAAAQRPISDFISAQGSTSLFFPPFPDFIAWANNNPQTRFAAVDYSGLIAEYLQNHGGPTLGTTVSGTVTERALTDGRAQVTVTLHVTNAMSWATGLPGDIVSDPPQFGYRQQDLLADPSLTPGLSIADMKVVFKNDAPGAPLPDLVNAFILGNGTAGQELVSLMFRSNGFGPLHAPFGVNEGTPGRLVVTQTGIFMTHFGGATADGFPAERVDLHVVGGGGSPGIIEVE